MFMIKNYGSADSLMHTETINGHFGIRCFDYFGEGEDIIVVYPTWDDVEKFISNNSNYPELFEILTGTEFDFGIDDAVLVVFDKGDNRRVICSRNAYTQRVAELESKRIIADGWRKLDRQKKEISEGFKEINAQKEAFRNNHAERMKEIDEILKRVQSSSSDSFEDEDSHDSNSRHDAVMKKLNDISNQLDAMIADEF